MRDQRTEQHVLLELRAEHTYTKALEAVVDGAHYGGAHGGTRKASAMKVYLSGDGNSPAYAQDMSLMRKAP